MSEFKGTPGEWLFVPVEKHPWGFKVMAGDQCILHQDAVAWSTKQRSRDENLAAVGLLNSENREEAIQMLSQQDANGKLFAASKELLEAMQKIVALKWGYDGDCGAVAIAEAAIAKATT